MTIIMTKYKAGEKDYLIYDKNILSRDFTAAQWAVIANGEHGVGANYIIEIANMQAKCYDKNGAVCPMDEECRSVLADYQHSAAQKDFQRIEVRFTDSYISRLMNSMSSQSRYIA